jgi:hypothetical protein
MPETATHDIQKLGLSATQTNHLRAHGITTIQTFGQLTEDAVVDLLGGSGLEQATDSYQQWFERNVCPAPPPLPADWKPMTQRSNCNG